MLDPLVASDIPQRGLLVGAALDRDPRLEFPRPVVVSPGGRVRPLYAGPEGLQPVPGQVQAGLDLCWAQHSGHHSPALPGTEIIDLEISLEVNQLTKIVIKCDLPR